MDRGLDGVGRDTFHSSPRLAEDSLVALGVEPDAAARGVTMFRQDDKRNLVATQAIYRDEKQLIQNVQQAAEELATLFEADRASCPATRKLLMLACPIARSDPHA